jgi:hypothetical protein
VAVSDEGFSSMESVSFTMYYDFPALYKLYLPDSNRRCSVVGIATGYGQDDKRV